MTDHRYHAPYAARSSAATIWPSTGPGLRLAAESPREPCPDCVAGEMFIGGLGDDRRDPGAWDRCATCDGRGEL